MADNMSTNLADLSLVTWSKTGVSNCILTYLKFGLWSLYSREGNMLIEFLTEYKNLCIYKEEI